MIDTTKLNEWSWPSDVSFSSQYPRNFNETIQAPVAATGTTGATATGGNTTTTNASSWEDIMGKWADTDWSKVKWPEINPTLQDYGYDPNTASPQYAPQWQTASDTLTGIATGQYMPAAPEAWTQTQDYLNQLIQNYGMPTSYAPAYQAAKKQTTYDIEDAIKQATEQAGLSGMRWSTPLGRTAQDISARAMAGLGSTWTTQELGAQESAMNRALQGVQALSGLGGQQAQFAQLPYQNALAATAQLTPLGQSYTDQYMNLAKTLLGAGTTMQAGQQDTANQFYQQFLRNTPEASSWMQQMLSLLGGSQGNAVPQQYQQSSSSSMLGILGSILPFLGMLL